MSLPKIIVFISGSGSNLQALMDAVENGRLSAQIALVVSNRKAAYGLVRAKEADIPTLYHPFKPYRDAGKSRGEYEADLAAKIKPIQPDLIVLAGWMHILGTDFLTQFPNQVINLHPALPGQFAGTHAIDRAFDAYQNGELTHSGCMVHYVIPEIDAGAVIVQAEVPILPKDTLDDFEERMHATEHRIIVEATAKLLDL
jgi:formyltetrahydrofolate-dependent phosphoribosylglycinamide formyltransferase